MAFFMVSLLLVLQVIIVLGLVLVIMLQKSSSDSLAGLSGGANGALLSSSRSYDIVSKTTITLAALFMANSIAIANLYNDKGQGSIVDGMTQEQFEKPAVKAKAPQAVD